ncbi:MAG TPA: hypothetical protein VE291_12340, partial [Terracidiphilus sp.]|nr:hypothetical protein [Terracidiphilus sp.]
MRATPPHRFPVPQAVALACALVLASAPFAQTPAQSPSPTLTPAPTPAPVKHHRKPLAAVKAAEPTPQPAVVVPPKPDWPIDNQPAPAAVTWDNRNLSID